MLDLPGTSAGTGTETTAVTPAPGNSLAAELRGFGPAGSAAMLLIILAGTVPAIGAPLVLAWAWWSRTPWREIGYARPANWLGTVAGGFAFGVTLKLLVKALVLPLLGADPINQAYHYLAGNRMLLPGAVVTMLVAGFAEETLYRGYLFERLGKLFGAGAGVKVAIVLFTTAVFGLAHYPSQGLSGVEQALCTGLAFGTVFALTRRIWLPMVAHAAYDLAALAIIYWDLETTVAHLVFR